MTSSTQDHTIIFLHGRGSSASTFASEIFESQDSQARFFPSIFPSVEWIFPCAPISWAASEHESIPQWFDMKSVQRPWEEAETQREGLDEAAQSVAGIVEREVKKVGWEKVVVAGISQGCVVGMYAVLKYGMRIGGFVGLCGWVPREDLESVVEHGQDVREMPVLLQHCKDDEVVPVANGEALGARLRNMGMEVRWECFDEGGHWLNEPVGMDGVVRFIEKIMKNRQDERTCPN